MSDQAPAREQLEARWEVLWARGQELAARAERIQSTLASVEERIGRNALEQLHKEQQQHERDLLELRVAMERHGGFS